MRRLDIHHKTNLKIGRAVPVFSQDLGNRISIGNTVVSRKLV